MTESWRRELERIAAFFREWDPIGVGDDLAEGGAARDEYDSYAPGVHTLLRRGATATEVAAHLSDIARTRMGIEPQETGTRVAAAHIAGWWASRK